VAVAEEPPNEVSNPPLPVVDRQDKEKGDGWLRKSRKSKKEESFDQSA
jgi:hypothetical protein